MSYYRVSSIKKITVNLDQESTWWKYVPKSNWLYYFSRGGYFTDGWTCTNSIEVIGEKRYYIKNNTVRKWPTVEIDISTRLYETFVFKTNEGAEIFKQDLIIHKANWVDDAGTFHVTKPLL